MPTEGIFDMAASKPVEPVVRALKLLEALNRKSASSLGDLRAATHRLQNMLDAEMPA